MHLCNTKYNSYQHPTQCRFVHEIASINEKGQFSQKLTITEENNINSRTWSP